MKKYFLILFFISFFNTFHSKAQFPLWLDSLYWNTDVTPPNGDRWRWRNKAGLWADPTTSQYVGQWGAPEKITQYAQHNLFLTTQAGGYYTNIQFFKYSTLNTTSVTNFKNLVGNTLVHYYYNNQSSSITNTALFGNINTGMNYYDTENLPDYAMNFYTDKTVEFINLILPNNVPSWISSTSNLASFTVFSDEVLSSAPYYGFHDIKFNYGKFNQKILKNPLPLFN